MDERHGEPAVSAKVARVGNPTGFGDRPFLGSIAIRAGRLTRAQLRGTQWQRLLRDVYLRRDLELDSRIRSEAVALVLLSGSVISGRTAAWLLSGIPLQEGESVEVTIARSGTMRPREGIAIRRAEFAPTDTPVVSGILVTSALRTGFDLARRRRPNSRDELVDSVVALDVLGQRCQCQLRADDLIRYAAGHPRWRDVRLVAQAARLLDPGAESPMETRLRLVLVFGGLPQPVSQYRILDPTGKFVARVDLAYPDLRIAIEYDGDHHRDVWADDIVRQNKVIGLGWTIVRYTSRDVYRGPDAIVAQVNSARNAAMAA